MWLYQWRKFRLQEFGHLEVTQAKFVANFFAFRSCIVQQLVSVAFKFQAFPHICMRHVVIVGLRAWFVLMEWNKGLWKFIRLNSNDRSAGAFPSINSQSSQTDCKPYILVGVYFPITIQNLLCVVTADPHSWTHSTHIPFLAPDIIFTTVNVALRVRIFRNSCGTNIDATVWPTQMR